MRLLLWRKRGSCSIRGFLRSKPETTLFIIQQLPQGGVNLLGAFIPDAEESAIFEINKAKAAAEIHLRNWVCENRWIK